MGRQQLHLEIANFIRQNPAGQQKSRPSALREYASRRLRKAAELGGYQLVDAEQVKMLVDNDAALLVDLRDEDFYVRGHLPGAISFPLPMTWRARLKQRWHLKKMLCDLECRAVVFYGASPSCRRSDVAACAAVIVGFPAVYRFAGGVDAWLLSGLTLENYPLRSGL